MCGLYGLVADVANGFTNTDMEVVVGNAWINQWRGAHSSGIVHVNNEGGYRYIKDVGGTSSIVGSKAWEGFRAEIYKKGKIVYGHGRYATRGDITVANAHPFGIGGEQDLIVFMHNGTLGDHQQLPGLKNYAVDSEWLGNMIYEHGAKHALAHVSGAIACMWYDFATTKFNVYRNHERPLFVVEYGGPRSKRHLINSEIAALMWLGEKYALGFKREDIKEFKSRSLYTIDPFNVDAGWTAEHIEAKYDRWNRRVITYPPSREVSQPPFPVAVKTSETPSTRKVTYPADDDASPVTERSYTHDVLLLLKGLVSRIDFDCPNNIKSRWTFWDSGSVERDDAAPYEEGLVSLLRVNDNSIKKVWDNGDGQRYDSVVKFDIAALEAAVRSVETPNPEKRASINKPVKWTSMKGMLQIKHQATVSKYVNGIEFYETYENDSDGVITVGDTVQVEVIDVEEIKGTVNHFRAMCTRLTPEQDRCITYVFSKPRWNEDELYKIGHFEGKITFIKRAEISEGFDPADVIVGLSRVHAFYSGKTETKNTDEEAVVVINTEAQNDK